MYEISDIAKAVHRQPFKPLKLHLSSGEIVKVGHPDGVLLTDYSVVVGIGKGKVEGAVADYQVIGLDHVVKVEPTVV